MTYLGDGATSEGDAHEAFNFAAVWQTPTVFLVQNNQFAISTPLARQSRAATLADKAVGYGMPGYHVDGNDVAAMYAVTLAAVERARGGGGPTLIEGLTYRIEPHTNSDDPTRYRHARDVEHWKRRDPIERLEKYLVSEGALGDDVRTEIADAAESVAAHTRDVMTAEAELDPLELFDHVYAHPRTTLLEQRARLEAELSEAAQAHRPSHAGAAR
jgi:pyruvate dehydrogenase E1 component alpha subunit